MKSKISVWFLVLGLVISFLSLVAAFMKVNFWYFPAVIGFWFVFDYFSSIKNKDTALQMLFRDKYEFFKLYFLMFMLGCTIEVIGRFVLKLWIYPPYTHVLFDLINLFFYPFILMSFRESYRSLNLFVKNKSLAFIYAMVLGILIWEIPNIFSVDWIYIIPFINFEIYHINIVVIIGWVVLIGFPIWIYNEFFGGRK
jgi:hypothetical protein